MINQNWVFGRGAQLNFSTAIPTATAGRAINTFEGCASISDSTGNLLLYTDGLTVWDATNTVRAVGLLGDPSSTQSSIIVPDPGNADQYYIFTTDGSSNIAPYNHFNGIRINVVTWAVTQISTLFTMPSVANLSPVEKLTAIQHANCRDFWVLTVVQQAALAAGVGPGVFRLFLVTPSGISHVGDTVMNQQINDLGYLKCSPDGSRLALANHNSATGMLVYPFDNASGAINVASPILIPTPVGNPTSVYGVEFSPNSSLLYYSTLELGNVAARIFQVNLAGPIVPQVVASYTQPGGNGRYAIGALQLGPDGRIYVAKDNEASLGAILNPDVLFPATLVNMSFITMAAGSNSFLGLPNLLPNACDCACESEHCQEEVDDANADLAASAATKTFQIVANGQTVPVGCNPAFAQNNFAPVFTMRWGDGLQDHFESTDTEVFYIQIRNPFSNVSFGDVKIFNIRVTPNQPLPGGGNTLLVIPAEIVCYEDIGPCSVVSRDFTIMIQGAIVGPYQITFDYCIGEIVVQTTSEGTATFNIDVVQS